MFGDNIKLVPQEFTPRDIGELKIWDSEYKLPEECQINDPDLPYCQTGGIYKITAGYYNRLEPYSHMNEKCATHAPTYIRQPEGC